MRRLTAANLLPERAGQPVKAWAHITLADLMLLDGDSALQDQWTGQVRARWAARRAHAAETGANDGAWLDGDAAQAIACDAAMAPIVTGDVNVDALENLVRLCVELDRLRQGGDSPDTPAADTTATWAAVEQAVIGKTIKFLLCSIGPADLAVFAGQDQSGLSPPTSGQARFRTRRAGSASGPEPGTALLRRCAPALDLRGGEGTGNPKRNL